MMIAYPLEFAMFSVQIETLISDIFNVADTETGRVSIHQFIICVNFGNSLVERRTFRRPELGRIYNKVLFEWLSMINAARILFAGSHFSVRRKNLCFYTDLCFLIGIINLRLKTYGCKVLADMRSCDLCSPYRHVHFISHDQMHITIQTCSRIPARGLRTIFQTYGQRIILSVFV